jgi:hypothetical protein
VGVLSDTLVKLEIAGAAVHPEREVALPELLRE